MSKILVISVICILLYIIFLSLKRIKLGHLFEPLNFFLLIYIPLYFLNALYIFFYGSSYNHYVTIGLFHKGLILAILGLGSYTIGYYLGIAKVLEGWFPKYNTLWIQTRLNITSIVILLIVILIVILGAIFSDLFNYMVTLRTRMIFRSGYAIWGLNIGKLGVWLLIANHYICRRKFRLREIAYIIFIIFISVTSGSRREFVFLIFGIILLRHYLYRKLSYKFLLVLFVILMGFSIIIQLQRNQAQYFFWARTISFTNSIHIFMRGTLGSFDYFLKILDNIPKRVDFQYGKVIHYILSFPIPRQIYPDKPLPTSIFLMKVFYPRILRSGTIRGATILGDLYINFHYVGIPIGMFLFGIISRAFYIHLNNSKSALLVYIPFIESLVRSIRGGISPFFFLIAMNVIPMFVILKFISSKHHGVQESPESEEPDA